MRHLLVALLALTACRSAPAPPIAALASAPYVWKRDGGLRQDEGDTRCRAELPGCRHAFGIYRLPPSPCAHRGTRCMEVPSRSDGRWSCGCDACASSEDCKPGESCGPSGAPCSHERTPLRCMAGPPPAPERCLEIAPPSQPR